MSKCQPSSFAGVSGEGYGALGQSEAACAADTKASSLETAASTAAAAAHSPGAAGDVNINTPAAAAACKPVNVNGK